MKAQNRQSTFSVIAYLACLALCCLTCGCSLIERPPLAEGTTPGATLSSTPTETPLLTATRTALPSPTPLASLTTTATATARLASPTPNPTGTDTLAATPTVTENPTAPPQSTITATPTAEDNPTTALYSTRERFGLAFNSGFGALSEYPLEQLSFGWYADWRVQVDPAQPVGIEFVQTIRVGPNVYPPNWEQIAAAIAANPGATWLIGNEPECIYQDVRTPAEYASIYHDCYVFIKERDPSAQVVVGGVVEPTPLRLQWLDEMWNAYQTMYGERLPCDAWHVHNQILQEKRGEYGCDVPVGLSQNAGQLYPWWENDSMDHFVDHIRAFRRWLADKGERDKPLILSEYGVLMPNAHFDTIGGAGSGEERVKAFMSASMEYMLSARDPEIGCPADGNRLVQRWLWFSLNNPSWEQTQAANQGFNGGLCDPYTRALTPYGEFYAQFVPNLIADYGSAQ